MPGRKSATKAKEVEVICKEEISSDEEEMDTSTASSRRRSSRAPKPVQKKSLKDASDEDSEAESEEDSEVEMPKKKGRAPAKKGKATGGKKANGTPVRGKKRQQSPKKGNSAKKAKKSNDDDDDEDYSGTEDEERNRSENGEDEDDEDGDETMDLEGIDDDVDDPNWKEPNYKDKEWFKAHCLKCQFCDKKFGKTGDALGCFNSHKHMLRCFVCFTVVKGKKNTTKKLFKHYQLRHPKGDKGSTVKCPHCDMSVAYKSVSCHIIAIHFREALGIPNSTPAKNGKGNPDDSEEEEEDEENVSGEEEEEEDED